MLVYGNAVDILCFLLSPSIPIKARCGRLHLVLTFKIVALNNPTLDFSYSETRRGRQEAPNSELCASSTAPSPSACRRCKPSCGDPPGTRAHSACWRHGVLSEESFSFSDDSPERAASFQKTWDHVALRTLPVHAKGWRGCGCISPTTSLNCSRAPWFPGRSRMVYSLLSHVVFQQDWLFKNKTQEQRTLRVWMDNHRILWCLLWIQACFEEGTPTQIRRKGNTWTLMTGIRELSGPSWGTRVWAVRVWPWEKGKWGGHPWASVNFQRLVPPQL